MACRAALRLLTTVTVSLLLCDSVRAGDPSGTRPLRQGRVADLHAVVPNDSHVLVEPASIEAFLRELDGAPPDWAAVYGAGHHDPGHDDRLFQLNRDRDAARVGREPLGWRLAFLWDGLLTGFDPKTGGFSVGIGPRFTRTSWGAIRFKPEDLPGNLTAIPDPRLRSALRRRFEAGERIAVSVVMTGRLIPEESLIYDFSHDEEGLGLIMPVVRITQIDYLLVP